MEYFGLILEFIFLALGIYIYLFAKGFWQVKDAEKQAKAETFRLKNAGWMRLLSIALIAIMTFEIILHIRDLMN